MIVDAMPGMNGAEAIARVCARAAAAADHRDHRLCQGKASDVQLLAKPFRVCELLARIASAVAADAAGALAKRSNILRCGRCKSRGGSSAGASMSQATGSGRRQLSLSANSAFGFLDNRGPWRLPCGLGYDPGMLLTALAPAWTLIATIS
jgi:hypothetical protein